MEARKALPEVQTRTVSQQGLLWRGLLQVTPGHRQQAPASIGQGGHADAPSPSPPEAGTLRAVPPWSASQARSDRRQLLLRTAEDGLGTGDTAAAPAGGPAFPVWCWLERSAHWGVLQGKGRTGVNLTVRVTSLAARQEAAEQTQKKSFIMGN